MREGCRGATFIAARLRLNEFQGMCETLSVRLRTDE
jgi:hypothetical protein